MKYKIHFSVQEWEDFFIVEADTFDEIMKIVDRETKARRLEPDRNNLWSEEVI